jgi:hypothetical protein
MAERIEVENDPTAAAMRRAGAEMRSKASKVQLSLRPATEGSTSW